MPSDDGGEDDKAGQKDAYDKMRQRVAKQGKKGVITADKRIAALFKVSHAIVQAFALVQKKRLAKDKVEGLADFEQGIELFKEVLKSWLIKCVRTPVSTILKAEEPLDFTNTFLEADR